MLIDIFRYSLFLLLFIAIRT